VRQTVLTNAPQRGAASSSAQTVCAAAMPRRKHRLRQFHQNMRGTLALSRTISLIGRNTRNLQRALIFGKDRDAK
jgi:hypothetical protein